MLLDAFKLNGRVAIVTGAGKGIGKAVAEGLAQQGAHVVCVARSQADIDATAELVKGYGVKALAIACDVRHEDQLQNLVAQTVEAFGGIDIVINNAGAPGKGFGSIEKVDKARFEHTIDINLTSAYTLIHHCLPYLRKSALANIVNVSSALSWMVDKNFSAYAAAKAGMNQMTKVMSYELAPHIRVNAVAPGAIETPSTSFITSDPQRKADTERWIPLQRLGKPEDIALGVLYLASDASAFVSGKVLEIDGGMQALPGSAIQEVIARGL
jgi:7-alpha-hydroxysteroid dehydrogenase